MAACRRAGGLAWREGADRGVSRAHPLGAPGTAEDVSSGGQFLGRALRWWAGRRWAGGRGHLHCRGPVCRAPRVGRSAGRLVVRPLGTPVTGFPVRSCDRHPSVVVLPRLLDGGCSESSGLPRAAACHSRGGVCCARPWAVSTWLCSEPFRGVAVFSSRPTALEWSPGRVGNVMSVCAWGSGRRDPRTTGGPRELRGLLSVAARPAAHAVWAPTAT